MKHINEKKKVRIPLVTNPGLFGSVTRHLEEEERIPENMKRVEMDGMPREVATAMLCEPKAKLSNRQRKECHAARAKYLESTRVALTPQEIVCNRVKRANVFQLSRWITRAARRKIRVQKHIERLTPKLDEVSKATPKTQPREFARRVVLERTIAGLHVRGSRLEIVLDACEEENQRRLNFCAAVAQVAPSVAAALQPKLVAAI